MEEKRKDTGTPPPANASATPTEGPALEPPTSRRRGGNKRKASALGSGNTSTPPTTSSKRQTREKSPPIPFPPIHNGPLTRARQQPNMAAAAAASSPSSASGVAIENEADASSVPPPPDAAAVKAKEAREAWEAFEAEIEAEYEAIKSRDANAHVVPTHAGWFSWKKVHPLEEKMLPSFFNGKSESRTSEIYIEIRNWIMRKYHDNPNTQIELKDLSELSVGDMEGRQEVMEFLDHWGLINFHPFPQSDSAPVSIDIDTDKDSKANSLVDNLFHFETEESCAPVIPSSNLATPALPSGLFPESATTEELVKSEGVEYHCNSCSADCSRKRYHCQKQADFDLCTECFNNGKFGSDMSPSDFILMEPAEAGGASGGKWTDQETLLLLEALELYKENWNEIAEHVATKTKAQCILHFVEMPIEDTFLDLDDGTEGAPNKENSDAVPRTNDTSAPKDAPQTTESKEDANENQPSASPMEISKPEDFNESNVSPETSENFALKALKEAFEAVGCPPSLGRQLSFADAGNPVMTLAAFLVRLVESNRTTASVRSSIRSISGHSSGEQLAARHCFRLEDPPDDKKEAADSERLTTETAEQEDQKDEDQNGNAKKEEKPESVTGDQNNIKQKVETAKPVSDGPDLSNDQSNEEDKDHVAEKEKLQLSSNDECTDKSDSVRNPDRMTIRQEAEPSNLSESENQRLVKEQGSGATEKSDVSMPNMEFPGSAKDSGDRATVGNPSQSTEARKDENMISGSDKESEQVNTSNPVDEKEEKTEEAKDSKNEKIQSEAKNDIGTDKIKRAATTALSAAAVKAKFLARQEEDQIRQLATLLIEKQLYKLELKSSFFSDMESVVMRVREQLERSKQRLYHERAQIIASRLGISATAQRPMSQSLSANRAPIGFANTAPRPPVAGTSPRPPASRSMMGPTLTSSPSISSNIARSSVQPPDQEKLSSHAAK